MKKFLEVLMDDDGNMHFSTDFQFPDSVENPPVNMEEYKQEHDQLTRKLMRGLVQEVWKKRSFNPSKAIRYLAMAEIIACAEPYEVAEEFWSTMMFSYIPNYEKFASKLKRPFGYDSRKMKRPVTGIFPGGLMPFGIGKMPN